MDVFSLVMAFLTSTTSLAAALVQYQTAKIAAQAAKSPTRRQRRRGCQTHNCASRRQKNAYRRSRREKAVFFAPMGRKICEFFAAMTGE